MKVSSLMIPGLKSKSALGCHVHCVVYGALFIYSSWFLHYRNYRDYQVRSERWKMKESKYKEPSLIDVLLSGEPKAAAVRDPQGQLPLHVAIMRGKTLEEGVEALVEAYPEALTMPDNRTQLFPFMLAASVGRGRGDASTIYALLRAAPELVGWLLQEVRDPPEMKMKETRNLLLPKPFLRET